MEVRADGPQPRQLFGKFAGYDTWFKRTKAQALNARNLIRPVRGTPPARPPGGGCGRVLSYMV